MTILLISPVSDLPTLLSGSAGADLSKWLAEHKYDIETLFGLEANRVALQAALQRAPTLICYDEETEIMTNEGFIPFPDIKEDMLIATLKPTKEIEFHHPIAIQKNHYKGDMIRFGGYNSPYDLMVTPEHKMFVQNADSTKPYWSFVTAEQIFLHRKGKYRLLFTFPNWRKEEIQQFNPPEVETVPIKGGFVTKNVSAIPMDLWLKFFAWWIAEGHVRGGIQPSGRYRNYEVSYAQKEPIVRHEMKSLIDELGFGSYESGMSVGFHSKQIGSYLSQYGKSRNKFLPRWMLNLNKRQMNILFETLMRGDGSKTPTNGYVYVTASKRLADNIQELGIKLGYRSSIAPLVISNKPNGFHKRAGHNNRIETTAIGFCEKNTAVIHKAKREYYSGKVYDVTVPNHVIFTRRRGKACWSGNCYFGHGTEDALMGTIPPGNLVTSDNVEWFAGKVFCTIACLSGQQLAPYAVSKGVLSYFGATDLMLTAFPEVDHDYLKDFIDCFTVVPRMILSGKNTQEAYDAYIAKCNDYITLYGYSGFASGDWYTTALKHNRDVYQLFGKTDARVADATNLIPESDVNLQTILAVGAAIGLGVGLPLLTTIATQRLAKL